MDKEMYVVKRNGKREIIAFDKILTRVKTLGQEFKININYTNLIIKVIDQLHDNIQTSKIDELTAEQAASLSSQHPDYGQLASVLVISNLHKNTNPSFSKTMKMLYDFKDMQGTDTPLLSKDFFRVVTENMAYFDKIIEHDRDYLIDYFGFKTLERAYLMHINKKIVERPQYMWLRVAICLHLDDLEKIKETYDYLSQKYFTHATPTLFNAGTPRPQLSSCFLVAMEEDSVDGIFNTLKECANISKWAGGIGLHIHNIRAKGSLIRGTNGTSNGIVPMLAVYNKTARYIDQGGGRRNGSFAVYIEPHHADIESFLELKKNHGDEELRARDLFYALWISDLFMERVKTNKHWSLFCPDSVPGLAESYGDEFKELYEKYENEKIYIKQINARDLWIQILDSQMETGTPYMLYKDSVNRKSNQQNLGTIKSSNLCCEITEYSNENETAVCNLASISLPIFVKNTESSFTNVTIYTRNDCNWCMLLKALLKRKNVNFKEILLETNEEILAFKEEFSVETVPQLMDDNKLIGGYLAVLNILRNTFNYKELYKVTKIVANNLNKVIDINFYPTIKTNRSNLYHRPIGIGVQGLADTFILMDLPFDSTEAQKINKNIFKTIYHAALQQSMELSKERTGPMQELKHAYENGFWKFTSQDKNIFRSYMIPDRDSSYADENIINLLKKLDQYKPIEKEIEMECQNGAYSSFQGSPASNGILQFDMWDVNPDNDTNLIYDWNNLKENIKMYGLRNSLLVAPMPTASTSQILGNNECFEPLTSNIYTRRTLAGEFVLANKYLIKELLELGIWNDSIKDNIILNKGSIQYIDKIPQTIKDKYKIVWEIPMKCLIDLSKDRGAYVCQSQSLNLWMEDPDVKSLTNMHFYAWNSGLKTGIYYLRRKPRHQPQQFTLEPKKLKTTDDYTEGCDMCSG